MFETSLYGPIEKALAIAHGIPESARGSFASALANLRKLGALGPQARVGRGAPLTYTSVELHRLVCAVELTEGGIAPATAVGIIDAYWDLKLGLIFTEAAAPLGLSEDSPEFRQRTDPKSHIVLALTGMTLRSGAWSAPKSAKFPGAEIDSCRRHELDEKMSKWLTGPAARVLVINVSDCLKRFHDAFAETYPAAVVEERQQHMKKQAAGKSGGEARRSASKRK